MAKSLNINLNVTADTGQAAAALKNLQSTLQSLVTSTNNLKIGGQLKSGITDATAAIGQLQVALKEATNIKTGNLNLTQFTQSMKASGMSLEKYQAALSQMGPAGKQAFAQLANSIATAEVPIRRSNALLQEMGTTIKNAARWQISSSIIHGFMGAIQKAYGYAQDLNKSLNNIQIVTQASNEQMAKFAESANRSAKSLSTTTTKYTDAALIYYQQGLGDKEVIERTNATIKMANVTGQSAEKVSNQMTAIWNNFDDGSKSLEYYADVITALGAATASSSDEISKGLEKFAAIADTVGLSYENATAALATITATTRQSADTVGTGLRTLFSRFQSLSLGETLEDNVDLTKYSKALKTIGVEVLDANGNLRTMDNILEDMGAKWQTLTEAQKMATAQTVGGVRQYTTLMALMENFDFYKQNQQVALSSEGTLQKQQAVYEQSWEAASKRVRASAESIYSDLLDDKFFIRLTNGFAKFLNIIDSIIDGLGGVKGILLGIGTLLTTKFAGQTTKVLTNLVENIKMLTPKGQQAIQEQRDKASNLLTSTVGNMYQSSEGNAAVTESYRIQGDLQKAYIANAEKMSTTQQQIAQQILAQNAALRQSVELTAQELDNTNKMINNRKSVARGAMNAVNDHYAENANKVNKLQHMGQEAGKASAYLDKLDFSKITDIGDLQKIQTEMQQLGLSVKSFSAYGADAARKFYEFKQALASGDIDAASTALDNLMNAMANGTVHADSFIEKIVQMAADAGATEPQLDNLRNALTDVFTGAQQAGEGVVQLGDQVGTLGAHAQQAEMTFQQFSVKIQSALGNIVETAGKLTTFVMGINMIKSAIQTLNNTDLTIGERITGAILPAIMGISMLASSMQALMATQAAEVAIGTVELTQHFAAAAAATIHAGANGLLAKSFDLIKKKMLELYAECPPLLIIMLLLAAAIAVVVGAIAGFKAIANAIVTPAEHLENLTEQTEQAKNSAEEAKQAYEDLLNGRNTYNSLLDELDKLTAGTLEFQEALLKANTAAQELISNNNLTPNDYELDSNGVIRIKPEALNKAQENALKEANDKQQQYLVAQSLEKNAKFQQSNEVKELETILSPSTPSLVYSGNKETYDAMGKQYGYNSGLEFLEAYQNNSGYFNQAAMIQSGVASQNQLTLQNALLTNRKQKQLTSFDNFLIGSLATNSNFWDTLDSEATAYYRKSGTGSYINLDDKNTTLTSLEDEYQAVYSKEALEKLQASEEYKNLTDKADQKKYLANAIKEANANKLLTDKLNHLKELSNRDEIKQYQKTENLTGEEILALRAKSLKNREKINELDKADDVEAAQFEQKLNDALYQRYSQASTAMLSTAVEVYGPGSEQQKQFGKLIKDLSLEQIEAFNTSYSEATTNFGKKTGDFITQHYLDSNGEIDKTFSKALSKFDLSQGSISALAELKSGRSSFGAWAEEEGNTAYQLASAMREDVGEKGLFEELYKSEDFQDSLKDIQKEFQKTGKISAKSIMDAAKSSQTLDKWLKASGIGAQGLADALETLGSSNIENISEALLRAFGAAGQLESSLAKTYDHIDNFEAERSIQDVGKFYKGLSDTVKEGFTSGFLMDKPVLQAFEDMFGADKKNQYLSAVYRATDDRNLSPSQISNEINTAVAPEVALMQSIQSRGNLSGVAEYALKQAGADSNLAKILSYNSATQQVTTTKWEDLGNLQNIVGDQEQFIKMIASEGHVSESLARDFANEYGSTNGNLQFQWRKTNVNKGLEEFGKYAEENASPIMGSDLRAFYDQYGDIFSSMSTDELKESFAIFKDFDLSDFDKGIKDADDLVKAFKKNSDKLKTSIVDLGENFDFTTDSLGNLKEEFEKNNEGQTFNDYFNANLTRSGGTRKNEEGQMETFHAVDIEEATAKFTALGATIDEAHQKLDEMVTAGDFTEFTASVKNADGELINLTSNSQEFKDFCESNGLEEGAASFDMYRQHVAETEEQLAATREQARIFAEEMVNALANPSGTDVKVNFDDDGTIEEIAAEIEGLPDTSEVSVDDGGTVALIAKDIRALSTIPVNVTVIKQTIEKPSASGYNNGKGFAGGKHVAGQYEGIAETGELGPELWIRDGQPYLTGIHGRTKIYIKPDDQIFTAAQTKEILRANPSMQDIPGFSVGYGGISWGGTGNKTAGKATGSGANEDNAKTSDYSPERYHLITRQLKDLQREYTELNDIKDNAYGTDKLKAIDAEIDATNRLIEGQKALVKEAKDYLAIDTERLQSMLAPGEFQVDQNGNLLNFEELQEKYRKAAEENKDDTHSKDVWKALEQYEETLDKFYDAQGELRELIYQEMEHRLEKITTKVDLKINFDEKELKLLDHYIKRIDDDIYKTAEVLALTEKRLSVINKKIKDTQKGIKDIFAELSDKNGNKITKADGSDYTLDEWLALTDAQREALNINDKFGEQLEEYGDNLLTYIEELEEFKTKGVEEVGNAFSELNENVQSSMELFEHYNSLLENLKNIVDLQGVVISDELKQVLAQINDAMMSNIQNNILAEQANYKRLTETVQSLRQKIADTNDPILRKKYEEQLKQAEEETRNSVQNLTNLWTKGLELIQQKFNNALDQEVLAYEKALSGIYGSMEEFSNAWDNHKKLNDFYVKDYEKYYQIAKMSRAWTKDIEDALRAGSRHTKGMQKVLDEVNAARESGIELTSYDLDIFEKRYEYEKALMELEDYRNNKAEVRLQRDANGNWGYVYTAVEDDEDLLSKQQAVDDKLYALQDAEAKRVESLQEDIKSIMINAGKRLQELYASGASPEVIQDYLKQVQQMLNGYKTGLSKALEDAGMTVEEAKLRYGEEGFDIIDNFSETLLSQLTDGTLTLEEFFDKFWNTIGIASTNMGQASDDYMKGIEAMNNFFKDSGEDLATVISGFASYIGDESGKSLIDSKEQIENAQTTFSEILRLAGEFEEKFMKIYEPIIAKNEDLLGKVLAALAALNGEDWSDTINSINKNNKKVASGKTGMYTGTWSGADTESNGKLAFLHQKELVLNQNDTENFLIGLNKMLNISMILKDLETQALAFQNGFTSMSTPILEGLQNQQVEQNVHIEASFPNVTQSNEIEMAFDNLVNKASQYANRKNMSSMTFGDAYISKF